MKSFDADRIHIRKISSSVARDMIVKHHYSHSWPAGQLTLGFYVDEKLNGVIVFGPSATSQMINSLPSPNYWELLRLFTTE